MLAPVFFAISAGLFAAGASCDASVGLKSVISTAFSTEPSVLLACLDRSDALQFLKSRRDCLVPGVAEITGLRCWVEFPARFGALLPEPAAMCCGINDCFLAKIAGKMCWTTVIANHGIAIRDDACKLFNPVFVVNDVLLLMEAAPEAAVFELFCACSLLKRYQLDVFSCC